MNQRLKAFTAVIFGALLFATLPVAANAAPNVHHKGSAHAKKHIQKKSQTHNRTAKNKIY